MIALTTLSPSTVVSVFAAVPNPLKLPGGDRVSAASVGWIGGNFALVAVTPAPPPGPGRVNVGAPSYAIDGTGAVTESYATALIAPADAASQQYASALIAGVTLTWNVSTSLSGLYAIDRDTQIRILAERVSFAINAAFTNGTTTLSWYMANGTGVSMTPAQAKTFASAVWQYLTALWTAQMAQAAGGSPTWPSSSVSVNG